MTKKKNGTKENHVEIEATEPETGDSVLVEAARALEAAQGRLASLDAARAELAADVAACQEILAQALPTPIRAKRGTAPRADDDQVMAWLAENTNAKEPATVGTIAQDIGLETTSVSPVLARLAKEGKVQKIGEKRATRYYL